MRKLITATLITILLTNPPNWAQAAQEQCDATSSDDSIGAGCQDFNLGNGSGGASSNLYPDCGWYGLGWDAFVGSYRDHSQFQADGATYYSENGQTYRETSDGTIQRAYIRKNCGNGNIDFWEPNNPEPDPVLVAIDRNSKMIPLPEPNVDPPPSRGSVVNFGLWLAVTPTESITASAHGRDTGVAVTATLESTSWDMGDGTEFTCDGGGTPIDEKHMNSIEPGPCGHIYEHNTPDDDPYTITVTTHWNVHWTATDGRSGTAPTIHRTNQFPYDVDEIITRGHSY